VGDPTELKAHPDNRLAIAPELGNNSYGQPICGHVVATPKPSATPRGSGGGPQPSGSGGGGGCHGNPLKCTPLPSVQGAADGTGATQTSPAMLLPVLAISGGAWLVPLLGRRRRRR
jgi:hypothetical protein